jgi:hypothetical protein
MTILSSNGLSLPKRIGNKTAFQQARILSRQALNHTYFTHKRSYFYQDSSTKRIKCTEWSNLNFSIDKALSILTNKDKF